MPLMFSMEGWVVAYSDENANKNNKKIDSKCQWFVFHTTDVFDGSGGDGLIRI